MNASVISFPPEDGNENASARRRRRGEQATYTRRQAIKGGVCDKATYEEAMPFYELVVNTHLLAGTPRSQWEPPPIVGNKLSEPYIQEGCDKLVQSLEREVDPMLDACEGLLNTVEADVDIVTKLPNDISTIESNTTYSGQSAVRREKDLSNEIENDREDGLRHHDRAPAWLRWIGKWAPWAEAVGFLAFVLFFLNIDILEPWNDWLGASFGLIIVVYIILGQTWLVDHAARAHNHRRDALADGLNHPAEASRRSRFWYLISTGVVALAITAGMVERGLAALGDADVTVLIVMVALAITTGVLMPTLSYLSKALDGSKASRERDGLADDLDADREQYDEVVEQIETNLSVEVELDNEVVEKVMPTILDSVQKTVNGAHRPYAFLRLQIGGLSDEPPARQRGAKVSPSTDGRPDGSISNGIPGADVVDLQVVFDRASRLERLRQRRHELTSRLQELPPHPWNHSSR